MVSSELSIVDLDHEEKKFRRGKKHFVTRRKLFAPMRSTMWREEDALRPDVSRDEKLPSVRRIRDPIPEGLPGPAGGLPGGPAGGPQMGVSRGVPGGVKKGPKMSSPAGGEIVYIFEGI